MQTTIADRDEALAVRSVIGKTLLVKGELSSDEEVLIEGKIEGKIKANNRLIIGKHGTVQADIEANEVIIRGTVNGNVSCSYKIEIVPEGILNGNIVSEKVVLAEGAIFKGSIDMTRTASSASKDEKKAEPAQTKKSEKGNKPEKETEHHPEKKDQQKDK